MDKNDKIKILEKCKTCSRYGTLISCPISNLLEYENMLNCQNGMDKTIYLRYELKQ